METKFTPLSDIQPNESAHVMAIVSDYSYSKKLKDEPLNFMTLRIFDHSLIAREQKNGVVKSIPFISVTIKNLNPIENCREVGEIVLMRNVIFTKKNETISGSAPNFNFELRYLRERNDCHNQVVRDLWIQLTEVSKAWLQHKALSFQKPNYCRQIKDLTPFVGDKPNQGLYFDVIGSLVALTRPNSHYVATLMDGTTSSDGKLYIDVVLEQDVIHLYLLQHASVGSFVRFRNIFWRKDDPMNRLGAGIYSYVTILPKHHYDVSTLHPALVPIRLYQYPESLNIQRLSISEFLQSNAREAILKDCHLVNHHLDDIYRRCFRCKSDLHTGLEECIKCGGKTFLCVSIQLKFQDRNGGVVVVHSRRMDADSFFRIPMSVSIEDFKLHLNIHLHLLYTQPSAQIFVQRIKVKNQSFIMQRAINT